MATAAPSLTTDDALLAEVSPDRLLRDTAAIARFVRLAGTPEERAAFEVIAAELRRIGLEVRRYECETYISIPGKASCRVLSPEPADLACITHSMAKPVDGLEAELVDAGAGSAEELKRAGAAGRIALVDGLASPGKVRAAERAGALAAVFVNDQRLHEMIVSAQYGSPTPATLGDLPKIAALSVTEDSGALLRRHLAGGPVRLRLAAAVDTGWRTIPLLSAELQPEPTDGSYVFWGTHVDSWHYGATDNAAGNAVALELARILVAHRSELRRGVRFVFWSGHSHGRYAGSCWYADHFWQDLYDHAVAAMSIDSPGGRGATELGSSKVMDELQAVAAAATKAVAGRDVKVKRADKGEQPLWRVGVPSINPARSRQKEGSATSMRIEPGNGYWHHSTEDLMENVEAGVLAQDARIYLLATWRLVASDVLPLDYAQTARAVRAELLALPAAGFDLTEAIALTERLERATDDLRAADPARANDSLRRLGRTLIPTLFTVRGPFDQDPTTNPGFIPGLQGLRRLATLDAASAEAGALRTALVRERTKLIFALREATQIAEGVS